MPRSRGQLVGVLVPTADDGVCDDHDGLDLRGVLARRQRGFRVAGFVDGEKLERYCRRRRWRRHWCCQERRWWRYRSRKPRRRRGCSSATQRCFFRGFRADQVREATKSRGAVACTAEPFEHHFFIPASIQTGPLTSRTVSTFPAYVLCVWRVPPVCPEPSRPRLVLSSPRKLPPACASTQRCFPTVCFLAVVHDNLFVAKQCL